MNIYVVGRATQGLADYLKTFPGGPERGVAIAYDSRHMSDVFAKETALVLAQNSIRRTFTARCTPCRSFPLPCCTLTAWRA